jgi:hypothetical protein
MAARDGYQKHFRGQPELVLADFGVDQGWASQTYYQRHLGDVNGDGKLDVVGIAFAGLMLSSDFSVPKLVNQAFFPNGNFVTALADTGADGLADLVYFDRDGFRANSGSKQITDYWSTGEIKVQDFGRLQGWVTQEQTPRLFADVNGDGRDDVIGFGNAGALVSLAYLFDSRVPSYSTYGRPIMGIYDFGVWKGWDSYDRYYRAAADVNGDGKDDIIGFADAGVMVALSKGDGTFADPIFAIDNFGFDQGWSSQDKFPRLLGDVNGDDRADIVGIGIAGVYVSYGQSDGTFAAPTLDYDENFTAAHGWTSNDLTPRMLADADGDGLLDLVGFGYAGVYVLSNLNGLPIG